MTKSPPRRGPIAELKAFAHAALINPVPRDHSEPDSAFRRRRIVAGITLILGAAVLAFSLRLQPGDPRFYASTIVLAAIWGGGAFASGQLHLGRAHTREGGTDRPYVQAFILGFGLLALFLVGALVVARIPALRGPVDGLLDHARVGSLPFVIAITAINGVAEELYFRGALYAAVGRRHAVAITTVAYTIATFATGNPMLAFAAALLGLIVGLQRRVTGGILGPIITHLVWSLGMLLLLPPLFNLL